MPNRERYERQLAAAGRTRQRAPHDGTGRGWRHRMSRAQLRPFIAIDGESTTDATTGEHRYVLMRASTGEELIDPDGLSSIACLDWLLDLYERHTDGKQTPILVAFGLDYDVNMMLRDLHRQARTALYNDGDADLYIRERDTFYRLEWVPRRHFTCSTGNMHAPNRRRFTISEVFGFFQCSFVRALEAWQIPDRDGALERIVSGKASRGTFQTEDMADVSRYCLAECEMLVALMERLRAAFVGAGFIPARWEGAGQAAGALLRREHVADHHRADRDLPPALHAAVMRAYFGGRVELLQAGEFPHGIGYDVNSAYPAAAADLPDLATGEWRRVRHYDPEARWALWRCRWHIPWTPESPVMPFPWRRHREIYYPPQANGWYWADEVAAAMALHPGGIDVLHGWVYEPCSDARPFDFVRELYDERRRMQAAGDEAQKAIKLALNSLYGKLAQGMGYKGRPPRLRSYVWAGMITSATRARILRVVCPMPEAVVFIATDGIMFTDDPDHWTGEQLGQLDRSEWRDVFTVRPGIYQQTPADGGPASVVDKTRGHIAGDLDFAELRRLWRDHGFGRSMQKDVRRFIGLGAALQRTDPPRWEVWRTWQDVNVKVSFVPARHWPAFPGPELDVVQELSAHGLASVRLEPLRAGADTPRLSDPYKPRTGDEREDWRQQQEHEMEQPDPYPDLE